jgi:hypothetical protein
LNGTKFRTLHNKQFLDRKCGIQELLVGWWLYFEGCWRYACIVPYITVFEVKNIICQTLGIMCALLVLYITIF